MNEHGNGAARASTSKHASTGTGKQASAGNQAERASKDELTAMLASKLIGGATGKTGKAGDEADRSSHTEGIGIGWTVFGYLISGMIAYGAIGWLIGKAVHVSLLFPIGMLTGIALSVGYVIHRYGRQGSVERNDR
jgi:F0F1-type ATP synthase assembly protein I